MVICLILTRAMLTSVSSANQIIHAALRGFNGNPKYFTFLYAKCSYILRCSLWHDLGNISGPWMV